LARDLGDQQKVTTKLKGAKAERDQLRSEQQAWDEVWPDAIKALGLSAKTSPAAAEASQITTCPDCDGRGEIIDAQCSKCAGTGQSRTKTPSPCAFP
jgi:RecJ-like exonuclease